MSGGLRSIIASGAGFRDTADEPFAGRNCARKRHTKVADAETDTNEHDTLRSRAAGFGVSSFASPCHC